MAAMGDDNRSAPGGERSMEGSADADPLDRVLNLADMEALARSILSGMAFDFVASGAADELTLAWNRSSLNRLRLKPRVLQDVGAIDLSTSLLGDTLPFPILLAPTSYHRLLHPDGEIETARGASAVG